MIFEGSIFYSNVLPYPERNLNEFQIELCFLNLLFFQLNLINALNRQNTLALILQKITHKIALEIYVRKEGIIRSGTSHIKS